MRRLLLAAVAVTSLACATRGKGAPEPEPPAPVVAPRPGEPPPQVKRWVELAQELASQLRVAGGDCGAVARVMKAFVATRGAELSTTSKALETWERGQSPVVVDRFYRPVFPTIEVRIDAGMRCKDDKPTVQAFDTYFIAAGLDRR